MKNINCLLVTITVALVLMACSSDKAKLLEEKYGKAETAMKVVTEKLDNPSSISTDSIARELVEADENLSFDFNEDDADKDDVEKFQKLHENIENVHARVKSVLANNAENIKIVKAHEDGVLINSAKVYPVYLQKGETVCFDVDMENPGSVYLFNADNHKQLMPVKKQSEIHESFTARFSAIYLVQIVPKETSYANIDIYVRSKDVESILHPKEIKTESVNASKGDFMAQAIDGIKMRNIFEEPRKFTLRGQLKAAFSGSSRAIVAIQVPSGAKDILYSLRISTNETPAAEDGEFKKNMDTSYHKIRILGLPVYESSRSIGLINTLLGENVPPREEDAYINMYVFYNALQARKFQNKVPTNKLKYNLDYSTVGTQSCDGRIPTKGHETIYLGFENERMRYNNYVWLEAVSSVPVTEYVRTKYSIEE